MAKLSGRATLANFNRGTGGARGTTRILLAHSGCDSRAAPLWQGLKISYQSYTRHTGIRWGSEEDVGILLTTCGFILPPVLPSRVLCRSNSNSNRWTDSRSTRFTDRRCTRATSKSKANLQKCLPGRICNSKSARSETQRSVPLTVVDQDARCKKPISRTAHCQVGRRSFSSFQYQF